MSINESFPHELYTDPLFKSPLYKEPPLSPHPVSAPHHLHTFYVPREDIVALVLDRAGRNGISGEVTGSFVRALFENDVVTYGIWDAEQSDDVIGVCKCPGTLAGLSRSLVGELATQYDVAVLSYLTDNGHEQVARPSIPSSGRLLLHD